MENTTPATKEQERAALKKIRKIVADLGEGSYLSYAFDGCFDIAEQNIENDFSISMLAARNEALEREEKAEKRVKIATEKVDELRSQILHMQKHTLTLPDLETCHAVVRRSGTDAWDTMMSLAEKVVELAEQPESVAFKDAVAAHRRQKKLVEAYDELTGRIDTAIRAHYESK